MIVEKQEIGAEAMALAIVWRNPLTLVQAHLRAKEAKKQAILTTDGQNKPQRFAHVGPIGMSTIAGRLEYC